MQYRPTAWVSIYPNEILKCLPPFSMPTLYGVALETQIELTGKYNQSIHTSYLALLIMIIILYELVVYEMQYMVSRYAIYTFYKNRNM